MAGMVGMNGRDRGHRGQGPGTELVNMSDQLDMAVRLLILRGQLLHYQRITGREGKKINFVCVCVI